MAEQISSTTIPATPKKSRGCFYYGCMTFLVIIGVIILGGVAIGVRGRRWINTHMMSTQPTTIETITLTTGEQRIAEKKQALIMTALHTGDALPTKDTFVELSDREINALIQQLSGWDTSPLKMTVDISSGTLGMRGYYKTEKNKYINASARLTITGSNGIVIGNLTNLQIGDRGVSTELTQEGSKNIFSKLYEDPEIIEALKHVKSVMISGNTLDLTLAGSGK